MGRRVDLADLVAVSSVNQRLPSGPAVMPGDAGGCGYRELGDSVGRRVDLADLVAELFDSVNQRLPSGPTVIPVGSLAAKGQGTRR